MPLELWNTSSKTIYIGFNNQHICLPPQNSASVFLENECVNLQLFHEEHDSLNVIAYVLNDLFTHELFRAALLIDGEYVIKTQGDQAKIKINDYEYAAFKDIAYRTFVFCPENAIVERNKLMVANWQTYYRKARFLYLFGSANALFSWSTIALIVLLIHACISSAPIWWLLLPFSISFVAAVYRYSNFLKRLKNAAKERILLEYMASQRKEHRAVWEASQSKHANTKSDEFYW